MTECKHETIARFREEGYVLCMRCRKEWTEEEAVEEGLFDEVNF